MNIREKFKRLVIEKIHGKPYDEAIEKERVELPLRSTTVVNNVSYGVPITIGRVMQALHGILNLLDDIDYCLFPSGDIYKCSAGCNFPPKVIGIKWKLTKENGIECTDDDQDDETIGRLVELLEGYKI